MEFFVFDKFEYEQYKELTGMEYLIISCYFQNELEDFKRHIDWYLQSEKTISKDMRLFITDVLCGRVKSTKHGNKDTLRRDLAINNEVCRYLAKGEKLTSNSAVDGAAFKVAEKWGMNEATVIKACERAKKYNIESEIKSGRDFEKLINDFCDENNEDLETRNMLLISHGKKTR